MNPQILVSTSLLLIGIAIAANTIVDLSQVKNVTAAQKINATIQILGQPKIKYSDGAYRIIAGRLEWAIYKNSNITFAELRKIDLEDHQPKKMIEDKPNFVMYESSLMGIGINFLYYTKIGGGVFCTTSTSYTTLTEARAMVKACKTIAAKK